MKRLLCVAFIMVVGLAVRSETAGVVGRSTPKGFTDDFEAARSEATQTGKKILAVFSGSDWCPWCKVLEAKYLSRRVFVDEAKNDFVLVFIDVPRDKSILPDTVMKNNRRLVAKYGIRAFPTVKILDADGTPLADSHPELDVAPEDYARQLRRRAKVGPLLKKHLVPFEDEMKNILTDTLTEMAKKRTEPSRKTGEDAEKATFILERKMMAGMIEKYGKLIEKAKTAKMPGEIEEDRKELVRTMTETLRQLEEAQKTTWEEARKMRDETKAARNPMDADAVRGLVVPLPEDAKLETEYFEKIAMPFYTREVVDAYRPSADVKPETAERIRAVRRALVRALATARGEFPTHAEFEMAHRLWREKCRDAAVAILHSDGLKWDVRYAQCVKIYAEALDVFDFAAEPFMGFLLRAKALNAGRFRIECNSKTSRKQVQEANVACSNALVRVAEIFKGADRRIAERLDEYWGLPDGAGQLLGDEYLARCRRAASCMDRAFDARGSGWRKDLTAQQARGWLDYNAEARSNLTAAVALRPEDTRATMMLASLDARSGCGEGDSVALMNRAVSNSLDRAAEEIERVLHFKTSRWGGSTEFLLDVIRAATTNVCTSSTFAYRTAAAALGKIFVAETDDVVNTNLANTVLTPDLSARLYGMLDAYIAANESPYMPDRDTFVGMAVSLALQKRDWSNVRKYAARYRKPLRDAQDAWWIRLSSHSSDRTYLKEMFEVVGGDPMRREMFIDAEIAMEEGRLSDADGIYRKLQVVKGLSSAERIIADRQGFKVRKVVQEKAGGWVDVMPTASGYEAMNWWGYVRTQTDGRAHLVGNVKCHYRLETPLPGKDAEYEATVHFETNDVKQTEWFIGWGLARPYTGFCASRSSWAFPYIGFYRDETGDHVSVDCPTRENAKEDNSKVKAKYGLKWGMSPAWTVYAATLENRNDHSFRLRWDAERIAVSVDGREVWSISSEEAMSEYAFSSRIQADYGVLPVWKVYKNTSFSGYRYRRVDGTR